MLCTRQGEIYMDNDLLNNIDKIHTTELGLKRIKNNLGLDTADIIHWCKCRMRNADDISKKGKNWYVYAGGVVMTVNAHSFTIITAHK